MSAIVMVKKEIRRALQKPINDAMQAEGFEDCIQWPGIPFERAEKPHYIATEINWGDVRVLEIGKFPRFEGRGGMTFNLHSPLDAGEDGNDALARIVASAYPYASTPSFDGVTVNVDKMKSGGYGSDGGWFTGLITVDWLVYRGR